MPKQEATVSRLEYKVKDLGLSEWGRNEIRLAEHEMPGLMAAQSSRLTPHDRSNRRPDRNTDGSRG